MALRPGVARRGLKTVEWARGRDRARRAGHGPSVPKEEETVREDETRERNAP